MNMVFCGGRVRLGLERNSPLVVKGYLSAWRHRLLGGNRHSSLRGTLMYLLHV